LCVSTDSTRNNETIQVSNDTVKPNLKHCVYQPIAHETRQVSNDTVKPNIKHCVYQPIA
ncbi:hypothetical protein C7212DRAFT_308059, partial [Tuber magnatum]